MSGNVRPRRQGISYTLHISSPHGLAGNLNLFPYQRSVTRCQSQEFLNLVGVRIRHLLHGDINKRLVHNLNVVGADPLLDVVRTQLPLARLLVEFVEVVPVEFLLLDATFLERSLEFLYVHCSAQRND